MAKKNFPKFAGCISMAMTPMVLTARLLKQDHPATRICFVGLRRKEAGSQPPQCAQRG